MNHPVRLRRGDSFAPTYLYSAQREESCAAKRHNSLLFVGKDLAYKLL